MSVDRNLIPSILKDLRREKGWSQERAAQEVGVSQPTLQAYETGRSYPWHLLEVILDGYGYELEVVRK